MANQLVKRIYARKCDLRLMSTKKNRQLAREFIATNHLQGWCRGNKIIYGLFFKEELVQVMTFGTPRYNRNFQWEIIRECSKQGVQVIGGASKLFAAFKREMLPVSVIVYTSMKSAHQYEHADHYTKHLGFKRLQKSKQRKQGRYVSTTWPRQDKYGQEYSVASIQRLGPDRMLGTKMGHDHGSNHEIMEKLGYRLEELSEPSPQSDYWTVLMQDDIRSEQTPKHVGYLYKVECSCGKLYVGMSERLDDYYIKNYIGSGRKWLKHLTARPEHIKQKSVIRWYESDDELRQHESLLIKAIFASPDQKHCHNVREHVQGEACVECGGHGPHLASCSKYKQNECQDCQGRHGHHRKGCSLYKARPVTCQECNGKNSRHFKKCSQYIAAGVCSECQGGNGHHKLICSKYDPLSLAVCSECNGKSHNHRKGCSLYSPREPMCSQCGSGSGVHRLHCPLYKPSKACKECGNIGPHKTTCSRNKQKECSECGSRTAHKKICSRYKAPLSCPDCGSRYGNHRKTCPHYKSRAKCPDCGSPSLHKASCPRSTRSACPECGSHSNKHKRTCSQHVKEIHCEECGSGNPALHRKGCSFYIPPKGCVECGSRGRHLDGCSKYIKGATCDECGSRSRHRKGCSKRKPSPACKECKSPKGFHKKFCSKYKAFGVCAECKGGAGKHKAICSKYIKPQPCADCGSRGSKHKKGCVKATYK